MYTPKGELNDKIYEMMKDEAAVEKLAAAKSQEEFYEIAKNYAEVSVEEFKVSMEIMKSYLEESKNGELSEEELEQVAGGQLVAATITDIMAIGEVIVKLGSIRLH
ncbi:MAG: hypothetical protein RSF88_01485 [Lachnospiraceae bacterium]